VALPVDPGAHEISGSAPGYRSDSRRVTAIEGKWSIVDLTLLPAPKASPPAREATPVAAPPSSTETSGRRVGAFVAGGVGIAGVVVGAVTGGLMLSKKGTVSSDCTNGPGGVALCRDSAGVDAGNSAKTLGLVSSVGWVTALVGLGVGTVLFATEPRAAKPSQGKNGRRLSAGLLATSGSGASFGVEGGF
jgi:hypothetical protein